MDELNPLGDAARVHCADQQEAQMATLGRQYAAFWRSLTAGGVPPVLAGEMLNRQQMVTLQIALHAQVQG